MRKKRSFNHYYPDSAYRILFSVIFFFLIHFSLRGQNSNAYVVSVLQAGDCNNAVLYDRYIDSICDTYKVGHLYYFIGIHDSELEKYSEKIFGKKFDTNKLVSGRQIDLWELNNLNYGTVLAFVSQNKICKIKSVFEFSELDITQMQFLQESNNQLVLRAPNAKKISDSLVLKHSHKVKVDDEIRLNKFVKLLKLDSSIYVLEPLFNTSLYQLDYESGKLINQINLTKLVPKDTLMYYLYKDLLGKLPQFWDTLKKYSNQGFDDQGERFYNIAIEEQYIYLTGDCEIISFYESHPIQKSFRIVYKFDRNLRLIDFFLDKYLSYSGYYPVFNIADNFKSQKYQSLVIPDFDGETRKIRTIYYKTVSQDHALKKFDKDSLIIPEEFPYRIMSNHITHTANFGHSDAPAWFLDPYPYFYFPTDGTFHNLINDSITQIPAKLQFKGLNGIINTSSFDSYVIINYRFENHTYKITYDLTNKKIVNKEVFVDLQPFNLTITTDDRGKSIYYPIEKQKENNFIYFE